VRVTETPDGLLLLVAPSWYDHRLRGVLLAMGAELVERLPTTVGRGGSLHSSVWRLP
jgi:hypothetical protein